MARIKQTDGRITLENTPLMVFDGSCVFCSAGARTVNRLDRNGRIKFAHAQSAMGEALYRHYGWNPVDFETNMLIDGGVMHTKWATIGAMGRAIGGIWRLASLFDVVPDFLGDRLYDLVARNRYRIFGRTESCALGDARMQARLIDRASG